CPGPFARCQRQSLQYVSTQLLHLTSIPLEPKLTPTHNERAMMRHPVSAFIGIAILLCCASVAGAANRFPNLACPDSVTIVRIQNASLACHPARLDTVSGVAGIVTGFDANSPGLAFYLQNNSSTTFTGIDVFTGSFSYTGGVPPFNLSVGDSVVVEYGTIQEFPNGNGTTEIEGPDGSQGTNDIIIRRVGAGSLPPFTNATTAT